MWQSVLPSHNFKILIFSLIIIILLTVVVFQTSRPSYNWQILTVNLVLHFLHQEYDKEVKGFVYCLEGSSQTVKMQTPDSAKVSRKLPPFLNSFVNGSFPGPHVYGCLLFVYVVCSWAPPKILGPSSKHSREQRFLS